MRRVYYLLYNFKKGDYVYRNVFVLSLDWHWVIQAIIHGSIVTETIQPKHGHLS